jgi:hypothetical protein
MLVVDAGGIVHAVYAATPPGASSAALWGDPRNRIVYRRSSDGGASWDPARPVSRAAVDSPVYVQPSLAVADGTMHVAYVTGRPSGAWDVVVASSTDGGASFRYRKANDEPDACATHTLPVLAADPARGLVHVVWLENRFGAGTVAYAACSQDPLGSCGPNEAVSDQPFAFTTSRDVTRWHGDYAGLVVLSTADLWAAWSDTRTGSPAVYMARGAPP